LLTIRFASPSNFDCGSVAARFSKLKVEIASSSAETGAVASRCTPSCVTSGPDVTSRNGLPKL
jgi:hypothetical protein